MARSRVPDSLLLWRDPGKLGRQEGYLCFLSVCPNPHCTAPHLFVEGYVVDDRYMGHVKRGKKRSVFFLPGSESVPAREFAFELDPRTGEVKRDHDADPRWASAVHLEGFKDALGREGALNVLQWVCLEQRNALRHRHDASHHHGDHDHGAHPASDKFPEERNVTPPTPEPDRAGAIVDAGLNRGLKLPQERIPVPKVGPNDRCPCGSGKKYKVCCG